MLQIFDTNNEETKKNLFVMNEWNMQFVIFFFLKVF